MIITKYEDGTIGVGDSSTSFIIKGKQFTQYEVGEIDLNRLEDAEYINSLIVKGKIIDNYGT